jgi:hypothetical protein
MPPSIYPKLLLQKEYSSRNTSQFPNGILLGLIKDLDSVDMPLGGWLEMNNFHTLDNRVQKYGGWGTLSEDSSNTFANPLNYAFDFQDNSGTRWFLVANKTDVYLYDRTTKVFASIATSYTGADEDRWQSAVINNKLVLVNLATKPQVFDPTSPATLTVLSTDINMPAGAKFILNSLGHLVMANIVEGTTAFPYRIRVSDFDATVWMPNVNINEASVFDLDGEIRGLVALGQNAFVAFTLKSTYLFTYTGLPTIWNVQRIVDDIGCFAPYSVISFQNTLYWLGTEGFYKFTGTSPQLIGVNRVDNFLFGDLYNGHPNSIYSFAHPIYPEIYFIYKSNSGGGVFDKALVYNWLMDCWSRRDPFPMSVMAEFELDTSAIFSDDTGVFNDEKATSLTWRDKSKEGTFVVVGGTAKVMVHEQGTNTSGDGVTPVLGLLQTGDLWPAGWQRRCHVTRVFFDILGLGGATQVRLGGRDKAEDPINFEPAVFLDSDSRLDCRLTARMYQLQIASSDLIMLSDISMVLQVGGERV